MVIGFSSNIYALTNQGCLLSNDLFEINRKIIEYTKNNFQEMHKLQTRKNGTGLGKIAKF